MAKQFEGKVAFITGAARGQALNVRKASDLAFQSSDSGLIDSCGHLL
jgi:hypothetical protein